MTTLCRKYAKLCRSKTTLVEKVYLRCSITNQAITLHLTESKTTLSARKTERNENLSKNHIDGPDG